MAVSGFLCVFLASTLAPTPASAGCGFRDQIQTPKKSEIPAITVAGSGAGGGFEQRIWLGKAPRPR